MLASAARSLDPMSIISEPLTASTSFLSMLSCQLLVSVLFMCIEVDWHATTLLAMACLDGSA
jgi:hypothetical protein